MFTSDEHDTESISQPPLFFLQGQLVSNPDTFLSYTTGLGRRGPSKSRLCGLSLQDGLVTGHSQNGSFQRNQQHREYDAGLALFAQGAKVRLGGRGHGGPAACPALEAIDGGRGVDGVKERHGDERGNEANSRRSNAGNCVGSSQTAKLHFEESSVQLQWRQDIRMVW